MDHDPFNEKKFRNFLQTNWVGNHFIYLSETDSTNYFLKKLPLDESPHGTVVLSDTQSAGRGQYGKKWVSDPCANLTFSVLFRTHYASRLPLLSLGLAYACLHLLERYIASPIQLKWPNDLIISGKKAGGLLTETTFLGKEPERMVTGIGLNILQTKFPAELYENAVSLCQFTDKTLSRERILAELLAEIEYVYQIWLKQPTLLRGLIQQKMIGYGTWLKISLCNIIQPELYKFIGINEQGELLLLNEQLDVHTFSYEQVRIITGSQAVSDSTSAVSA